MSFLSGLGSAIGGMFSSAAPAAAGAGAGLSGAAGASLTGAGMASSMGYGAPIAAGAAASAAPAAAAGSSGFMSGLADASGLITDGKFDSKKAGGMVGSLLGQGLMQGGQGAPQPADIKLGDISAQVQQAMGEKPWANPRFDSMSYINRLMSGG
jgi:hypothetical protein